VCTDKQGSRKRLIVFLISFHDHVHFEGERVETESIRFLRPTCLYVGGLSIGEKINLSEIFITKELTYEHTHLYYILSAIERSYGSDDDLSETYFIHS